MQFSLDGGETYQDAPNGIRILYDDQLISGADRGDLLINCTNEGVIMDVWNFPYDLFHMSQSELGENIGTSSETIDELIVRLMER